jgi:hypothetical protein
VIGEDKNEEANRSTDDDDDDDDDDDNDDGDDDDDDNNSGGGPGDKNEKTDSVSCGLDCFVAPLLRRNVLPLALVVPVDVITVRGGVGEGEGV